MRGIYTTLLAICASAAPAPTCSNGRVCPHIFMVVIDDLGWNNVPWHNPDLQATMPHSLGLVKDGVELDRHYTFVYCSPTRSSLLSGRFPYHVNQINLGNPFKTSGIHPNMTTIPRKLKDAGYKTHMVGKWHCGFATPAQTPHGRGFDTHLGFFAGSEDHWTQRGCIDATCNKPDNNSSMLVDLWLTDGPAFGRNGTDYGDHLYTQFALENIHSHPVDTPMFYYIAMQNNHQPLQAPQEFVDLFPSEWTFDRRMYAAMGAYWDLALHNITSALKAKGMWEHTLMVVTSDNGGPTYPSTAFDFPHCGGANNWPLFGGKVNGFEGGVRTAAFASGGFLPDNARGTKVTGNIHVTDWYATFCSLAGVDHADEVGVAVGVPDTDSVDIWDLLVGINTTSPRYELPLVVDFHTEGPALHLSSVLIQGDFKLLVGAWDAVMRQKQAWPDETACCEPACWVPQRVWCGTVEKPRCLYNIREDPTETTNLAKSNPELVSKMAARLQELQADVFRPQDGDTKDPRMATTAREHYGGYVGPWLDLPAEGTSIESLV